MLTKRVVTITINDRCPLSCKHCSVGYGTTYHGSSYVISDQLLDSIISSINLREYGTVAFSGGEPSLAPEVLAHGIELCRRHGLACTVTTAPVWAKTPECADRFTRRLAGIDLVLLSFDQYHLEQLSMMHYQNAIDALKHHQIEPMFIISHLTNKQKQQNVQYVQKFNSMIEYHQIIPLGNGSLLDHIDDELTTINTSNDILNLPKSCIIGNPVIDQCGNFNYCSWSVGFDNPPFKINCKSRHDYTFAQMQTSMDTDIDHIYRKGIIESLNTDQRLAIFQRFKGHKFINECHLCLTLMRTDEGNFWSETLALPSTHTNA